VQTFKQDWQYFYPLDAGLQANLQLPWMHPGTTRRAHLRGVSRHGQHQPELRINSEVSYRFGEHWYLGGFVSANNTDNYNAVSGGFFFRYALRKQHASRLPQRTLPVDGFRPLRSIARPTAR